jgi:hypothetical protein
MWLPFEPDVLWEALQGPWAEGVVRAETLMRARLLSDLGFARKQGRLSLGREKVIARLTKAGENGVLIHAIEASAGELRKLGSGTVGEKIGDFTTDELSHCSGGTYVVYAATEKRYLPPLFWRKLSQWRVVHAAMKDKVQA